MVDKADNTPPGIAPGTTPGTTPGTSPGTTPGTSPGAYPGYRAAQRLALLAGLFGVVVAALMLYNHWQLKVVDPLNSPELAELKVDLTKNPGDEPIKQRIRDLDLRLRNEFYQRKRFSENGAYLLLVGVAVMVVALKLAVGYRELPPMPTGEAPPRGAEARRAKQMRWAVGLLGIALGCSAVVLTISAPLGLTAEEVLLAQMEATQGEPGGAGGTGGSPDAAGVSVAATAPPPTAEQLAANWPGFRGPGGSGVSHYDNVPDTWDGPTRANILWKTPLPLPGKNSVVVWADRLFCTGANKSTRQVYCLDTTTGRTVWLRRVEVEQDAGAEPVDVSDDTGFAAPTGVTDGRRFYAIFANGHLAAFDFTGRQVWALALGSPQNHYGHATSLAMHDDLLLVQFDQAYSTDELSFVMALDGATGKEVWKVSRPVNASWSSPIVINTGGVSQLITVANPYVMAYDPASGAELWRSNQISGEPAPAPIFAANLVLAIAPMDQLVAIRPDGSGDVTETHVAWSTLDDVPDIVSPLSDGQFVYMLTTGGLLTCCSIKDGSTVWQHDYEMTIRSSPSLAGERIYLTNSKGVTFILRSGAKFEQLGSCDLGEPVDSTLAMLDGRIYLRTDKHAYGIGGRAE